MLLRLNRLPLVICVNYFNVLGRFSTEIKWRAESVTFRAESVTFGAELVTLYAELVTFHFHYPIEFTKKNMLFYSGTP
jgi:hypothetical protein